MFTSFPCTVQPGEAVDLNIECLLNGAKVVWKSSGGVDVINLDYNCLSINSNTSKTVCKIICAIIITCAIM